MKRRENIAYKAVKGCRGCEAGVADGQFSERLINTGMFSEFYCVDKWDDAGHPDSQYRAVLSRLENYSIATVIRSRVQEFAGTVPDDFFGFIYIDCYAHTGQDDGGVLSALWPKLSAGGIFAGDDYDFKKWPKTVAAVNNFAAEHSRTINIWDGFAVEHGMDRHAGWWIRK